jgi:outer membrane lipoprotein carrier protein
MMKPCITGWMLALVLVATGIANAKPVAGVKPIVQLKAFLLSSKSLTADFKQVTLTENGQPKQTSYGVFYLQRPGKFRWDYQKPFLQEIVSNAGKVWFYDTDLEQVTVKKVDESLGSTPALLLSGDVALEEKYTIDDQGEDEGMRWIKLMPKSQESSFKYVLIGFSGQTIAGMELKDNFGQLTRIYFSHVLHNPPIKPSVFEFIAPKGVDVFGE